MMKNIPIMEAALVEKQEYLEELIQSQHALKAQIEALQEEIDNLLTKILESSR